MNPVNWERRYQNGDTPWDKGLPAPPLTDFLKHHPIEGEVLVPGCGTGHDVRAIAQHGASVIGLDLAASAIKQADSFPKIASESYLEGDLFSLPPSFMERFDWVVEHTCFCAIPPTSRPAYLNAVLEILKPGGLFLGIFFINPDSSEGPPFPSSPEEITALFEPHFKLIKEWLPVNTYEGREERELCRLYRKSRSLTSSRARLSQAAKVPS
jgi:SAM-dependent methyltransferase